MKHKVIFDKHAQSVYEAQNELRFRLLRLYEAQNELRFRLSRLYEAKNELRFWLLRLYEAQNELRFCFIRPSRGQNELRFRFIQPSRGQNEFRFCFIQSSGRQNEFRFGLHIGMEVGKRNVDRPSLRWSEPKADLRLAFPLFAWHSIGVSASYRLRMAVGRYLIYRRAHTYDN